MRLKNYFLVTSRDSPESWLPFEKKNFKRLKFSCGQKTENFKKSTFSNDERFRFLGSNMSKQRRIKSLFEFEAL